MAKIDTLIDLMVKRQAEEALLVADHPSSALVNGQYKAWPARSRL